MKCSKCPCRLICEETKSKAAYCIALGKPWEPQDDKETIQVDQSFWEKQHARK